MKKTISLLLSVLMLVSMFSVTCAQVFALEAEEIFTITNTGFSNDEITYVISLAPNQTGLKSAVMNFYFDNTVLAVNESKSGPVGESLNYNEFDTVIDGLYEKGSNSNTPNKYTIAFFNPNGASTGDSAKSFVKITFKAISEKREETKVDFECSGYITDDEDSTITKAEPVVIATDSFTPLNAVKNKEVLSATEGLKFVWENVVGAKGYNIYRRAENETEWTKIADVSAPDTEYVDVISGDDLNKVFEYVAEPYNFAGFVVPHSDSGVKGKYFGTITYVNAEMTETGANVSWTPLDGADSYSLYQKAENEKDFSFVKNVKETSCDTEALESGVKYYFTVKAHSGEYLAETSAKDGCIEFLGSPDDVVANISDEAITLNWKEVKSAVSYNIYKKASDESEYSFVENVIAENGAVTYQDKAVENGKIYLYKIQSVKNAEICSVLGTGCVEVMKLPVVKNVTTELGENCIIIKWDAADFADGYKVFKRDSATSGLTYVGNSANTEYRDTRVASGKTYTYEVSALGGLGLYETENSKPSNETLYIATPTVNNAVSYGNRITVTWKSVGGADSYEVYRWSDSINGWEYCDTVSTNAYDDYDVVGGNVYGYTIIACIGDKTSLYNKEGVWVKFLYAPTGFWAGNSYDGVNLSWNPVAGAEGYVLYHKTSGTNFTELARLGADATSYTHTAAVSGKDNIYSLYAYSGVTYSEPAETSARFLTAPKLTSASLSNRNSILLAWGSVEGADSYNVYRKDCNGENWNLIATGVTRNSYLDSTVFYTNNYVYTVQACYGDSVSSFDPVGISKTLTVNGTPSLKNVNNVWRCVVGSSYNYNYKGLVEYSGGYYYVSNGNVDWSYTGLVAYNNEYYYVVNGVLDWGAVTLTQYNNEWYYVEYGHLNKYATTLVSYGGTWYYVENGKVNWNSDTLVFYDGSWYCTKYGEVAWWYTGLEFYAGNWYYVENGVVNWNSDTLVSYDGNWYYAKNGEVAWWYTGLVFYSGEWYYVQNGVIDWSVTTLTNYNGTWYYVENGKINWNSDTLVWYEGNWYCTKYGEVAWWYTGLVFYSGEWYYVQDGVLNFGVTTLTNYNGTWYYVEESKVNWNSDTLVWYEGYWYCTKYGEVAWWFTGIVEYYGVGYYVENGMINWEYTGQFKQAEDKIANIENGIVTIWSKSGYVNPVY